MRGGVAAFAVLSLSVIHLNDVGLDFRSHFRFGSIDVISVISAREFKLVVFDLDFTLWDAGGVWCDCLQPPFARREGRVFDAADAVVHPYECIPGSLEDLGAAGFELGIASRTTQPKWARELLDLLGLRRHFSYEEIYPSSKLRHFAELKASTGYDYSEMLFFDDEMRNIEEVGELGVRCVHVRNGFRRELLDAEIRLLG